MPESRVTNTQLLSLPINIGDDYGSLVAIESCESIPFEIKRVYYIFDVPSDIRRGLHSHRDLEQVLICLKGSVIINICTPMEQAKIRLDNPKMALYIGPMVWREMYDFSQDAILLVLANKHYDKNDYIRDKADYLVEAMDYFTEAKEFSKS